MSSRISFAHAHTNTGGAPSAGVDLVMSIPEDPYAIVPEPLRTVMRDGIAAEHHRQRQIGAGVAAAGSLALAWLVAHAWSTHAWQALAVPLGLGAVALLGGLFAMAHTSQLDARLEMLHRDGNRITGAASFVGAGKRRAIGIPMTYGNWYVKGKHYIRFPIPESAPLEALVAATEQLRIALDAARPR
jgi:hypothetical protein